MGNLWNWLEDNPVGVVLSALCGALVLVLLLLTVVSALPLSSAGVVSEENDHDPALELPQLADNQPIDTYSVIAQRPLFNESRQPSADGTNGQALLNQEPVNAPEVELSGVIITPTLRMVTLKRKDNEQSLVAFEGKPIEADFGSWQVSSIAARAATLTSGGGEELQLEMQVHDEQIEVPDVPAPKAEEETAATDETAQEPGETEPISRAEEIRQRIAERREELRREAEQQGQGEGQDEDPENYQNAIQSMIAGKRKRASDNENDQ